MTEARKDLIQALVLIQNHPAHSHHDILTITGCGMSDDEVRAHIECCMQHVINYTPRKTRKAA